jgi:hypothetical protein
VGRRTVTGVLLGALLAAGTLGAGPGAAFPRSHTLLVGAVEDGAKYLSPGVTLSLARETALRAIVVSSVWRRRRTAPDRFELARLEAAARAARASGFTLVVAVYFFGADTPRTGRDRSDFDRYAGVIVRALPGLRYVSLGNEPNSSTFWRPQFGPHGSDAAASGYFALLSGAYDAMHAADPELTIIGGSLAARGSDNPLGARKTHSPTRFLEDLGAAAQAAGRGRRFMDILSLHPYPPSSAVPPTVGYGESTSIGIEDYPRLVRLMTRVFGRPLPIAYGEYGIETRIPPRERRLYSGSEPAAAGAVDEARQANDYVAAMALAACQPLVRMLFFFHVIDERSLGGMQTGLFYPDNRPKASVGPVAAFADAVGSGEARCPP